MEMMDYPFHMGHEPCSEEQFSQVFLPVPFVLSQLERVLDQVEVQAILGHGLLAHARRLLLGRVPPSLTVARAALCLARRADDGLACLQQDAPEP